jgi:hypothetical protein
MIHIKKFLDKVSVGEAKKSKDIIMPIMEARGLRDEISKLLGDLYEITSKEKNKEEVIKVEITGGNFK